MTNSAGTRNTTPTAPAQPPIGIRLFYGLRKEPDLASMTPADLAAYAEARNRTVASPLARLITGFPHRAATITWQQIELPGRTLKVRVYRPKTTATLPLVLHVHGGGYTGTAMQCDWINSHVAARLPAVVVSVDHRLLDEDTPLSAAVDDGWDVWRHVLRHADEWGVDRSRTALVGESAGSMVAALSTLRARDTGLLVSAQVLVNPCTDLTETALDCTSMFDYADTPTLTTEVIELFRRLAVPEGTDARAVSPLYADDLSGLPPTLIVVPALDPVADHGRAYADRLRAAGTPVELREYDRAGHAFISLPGLVPQARPARERIVEFLREQLGQAG